MARLLLQLRFPSPPPLAFLLLAAWCGLLWFEADASTTTVTLGKTVAGGLFHTCIIVEDKTLRCFGGGGSDRVKTLAPSGSVAAGFGNFGQIGLNDTLGDNADEMGDDLPAVELGDNTVEEVFAGQSHTCVLLTSGSVACWGFNENGQLGLGDEVARGQSPSDMGDGLAFVDLGTDRTAVHIGGGQHHTCAVLDDGSLKCWGDNGHATLGLGDIDDRGDDEDEMGDKLPAIDLGTGRTAVEVDGGRYHTCAVLDNGALKCWGAEDDTQNVGQLGQGNIDGIGAVPGQMGDDLPEVDLGTGRTVLALATGWSHTCVLLDDASMKCFGRNNDGQLGLGDEKDRGDEEGEMGDNLQAVDLGTARHAVAITCGRWHTCVLLDNDDVKCFGVNDTDDLGEGQLGLEDADERGETLATSGDGLEVVELGTGRVASWIFAAFDHTCVIFADRAAKCWGLNASGQLGLENEEDQGNLDGSMGDSLSSVQLGMKVASAPSPVSFDSLPDDGGGGGLSEEWTITVALLASAGFVCLSGAICVGCRRRLEKKNGAMMESVTSFEGFRASSTAEEGGAGGGGMATGDVVHRSRSVRAADHAGPKHTVRKEPRPAVRAVAFPVEGEGQGTSNSRMTSMGSMGSRAGMAAAGTAGVAIAGAMAAGWNVIGVLAENLPWIGVAYHMLNEIVDIVDTKQGLQGNMAKIKSWAISLQDVIMTMGQQMKKRPMVNARALEHMSADVISNLQTLVDAVASYDQKGALAQYAASRSCQKAVDAADTSLRGALAKLAIGQGAELMAMVGRLEDAGLVVDEKLDMIIEHLRKQDEHAVRLELRLAKYSENMAEVLGQYSSKGDANKLQAGGKTLTELGKVQLDKLQISKKDVSYPSNVPFATGTFSEVYQVVHEGTIKAAKVTNLSRLGVGRNDVDRVFGRFVKELYILSQMQSDRVVRVYGAIATPTELTLVMELAERGSLRMVLGDDEQRAQITPAMQHKLLLDTASGMEYIYKNGVEHRDLKSDNCLVSHSWRAKITDFGLSKTTDAISTGTTSNVAEFRGGTLVYMAPELMSGGKTGGAGADGKVPAELSDMYSYGVIVWDVMCGNGELPWAGVDMDALPARVRTGERLAVPSECGRLYRDLMRNCWREHPRKRPTFDRVVYTLKRNNGATEPPSAPRATTGFSPVLAPQSSPSVVIPPPSYSQALAAPEPLHPSSPLLTRREQSVNDDESPIAGPPCDGNHGSAATGSFDDGGAGVGLPAPPYVSIATESASTATTSMPAPPYVSIAAESSSASSAATSTAVPAEAPTTSAIPESGATANNRTFTGSGATASGGGGGSARDICTPSGLPEEVKVEVEEAVLVGGGGETVQRHGGGLVGLHASRNELQPSGLSSGQESPTASTVSAAPAAPDDAILKKTPITSLLSSVVEIDEEVEEGLDGFTTPRRLPSS